MKRSSVLLALAASVAAMGCGVSGSGDYGIELRVASDFDRVEVQDDVRVQIAVDRFAPPGSVTLTVTGDDNLLSYVDTEVSAGTLFVATDRVLWNDLELRVTATVDHLSSAAAYDQGHLYVEGIYGPRFDIDAEDASRVWLGGSVDLLDLHAEDAAHVDASDLHADRAWVDVDDTASVAVCADDSVRGDVADLARVDVYCNPTSSTSTTASCSDGDEAGDRGPSATCSRPSAPVSPRQPGER